MKFSSCSIYLSRVLDFMSYFPILFLRFSFSSPYIFVRFLDVLYQSFSINILILMFIFLLVLLAFSSTSHIDYSCFKFTIAITH